VVSILGEYIHIFKARSINEKLRERRGGGIVTQLLIDALEEKIIEKVLLVKSSKKRPWAEAFLAEKKEDIIKSRGSKYTFVSYKEKAKILQKKDAIVGLPCQCKAIKKDVLKIGLFCGLNISSRGYDYLFRRFRINEENIKCIDYRCPEGGMKITLKNGRNTFIKRYVWLAFFFPYLMCLYCKDHSALYADISVGDFEPGWSTAIVRTERGEEVFFNSVKKRNIEAITIEKNEVIMKKIHLLMPKEVEGGFINKKLLSYCRKIVGYLPWDISQFLGNSIYYYLRKKYQRHINEKRKCI